MSRPHQSHLNGVVIGMNDYEISEIYLALISVTVIDLFLCL